MCSFYSWTWKRERDASQKFIQRCEYLTIMVSRVSVWDVEKALEKMVVVFAQHCECSAAELYT